MATRQKNPNRRTVNPPPAGSGPLPTPPVFQPQPQSPGPNLTGPRPGNRALVRQARSLGRLDTLAGQFNTLAFIAILLAAIALLIASIVISNTSRDFRRVITDAAPSIAAAEELGQALNQLHTAAADLQVTSRVDVTSPDFASYIYGENGVRSQTLQTYLQNRQQFSNALARARANITYPGEADALNIITSRFYDYVGHIDIMRNELEQNRREAALAEYKAAQDIVIGNLGNVTLQDGRSPEELLHQKGWAGLDVKQQYVGIQANIAKLAIINQQELEKSSTSARQAQLISMVLLLGATVLLLAVLFLMGLRYAIITHRIFNPGYLLALLVSVAMLVWLGSNLNQAITDFNTISSDSFTSIRAASQAKELMLDFNGDESRLLLSSTGAGLDNTSQFLTASVREAFKPERLDQNFKFKGEQFEQQIAIAWKNITYPAERAALCAVMDNNSGSGVRCSDAEKPLDKDRKPLPVAWPDYLAQHTSIVNDFNKGLISRAISTSFTTSNAASTRATEALDRLSNVNKVAFDKAACSSIGINQFGNSCNGNPGYLNTMQTISWVAFPIIIILVLGGAVISRRLF